MGFRAYEYDKNGNLVKDGVPYDNKINLYRTNDVWMFTNSDYSINNALVLGCCTAAPIQITGYNGYGLPLGFSQDYLFNMEASPPNIEYSCDPGYPVAAGGSK